MLLGNRLLSVQIHKCGSGKTKCLYLQNSWIAALAALLQRTPGLRNFCEKHEEFISAWHNHKLHEFVEENDTYNQPQPGASHRLIMLLAKFHFL